MSHTSKLTVYFDPCNTRSFHCSTTVYGTTADTVYINIRASVVKQMNKKLISYSREFQELMSQKLFTKCSHQIYLVVRTHTQVLQSKIIHLLSQYPFTARYLVLVDYTWGVLTLQLQHKNLLSTNTRIKIQLNRIAREGICTHFKANLDFAMFHSLFFNSVIDQVKSAADSISPTVIQFKMFNNHNSGFGRANSIIAI